MFTVYIINGLTSYNLVVKIKLTQKSEPNCNEEQQQTDTGIFHLGPIWYVNDIQSYLMGISDTFLYLNTTIFIIVSYNMQYMLTLFL